MLNLNKRKGSYAVKKVLSLLLAVLMVFTLLPVSALADGETPGTAETTAETETTPVPEVTPEPETTPEPEEQTEYPWEDMTDEEFAAYIYAEENREYLISLMTGADEDAYISFADRIERIEDEELYVQLSGFLYGLLGTDATELASTYSVVMTADSFIQYLKTALSRKTVYNNTYPYNVGYYDGSTISWDCWNLGKSIIWSNGAVVSNYTTGNYVGKGITRDQSCGLGDWTGSGILQACESYSSDFSSLVPGEWLFMGAASSIYHVGYYIGDRKVIECTSGSFKRVIESNIDSNGYSSTTLNTWSYHAKVPWLDYTVGTTPVVNTKKITFDCQGGSAETYTEEMSFAGVNCERGENSIIYNISGATVDTNTYGREIAIDATGKVVSIRDYGDETRIRVPENGLVVSQHAEAGGFCWAVQIGNYVGVDYTISKAYLYTSVDGYLLNHKTVAVGGQYGVLPTPKRETYTFDGWYTAASGGTKITAGSTYSVDKLYAHWTSNDPCASGHNWNSGTVTTAATCEKAGIKTYTCTVCKTTKTETIAALGHSYKETKIAGSCTQRPGTKYDCTRCGNSYTAWDEASWSSWSTEKPSGYTGGDIESATQYRYRDKDTTTSSSASMTGWTLSGSEKVWGDYGAWSDWTTEAVSASDSTQVETAPLYRYYYFLCSKCGDHNPFSGNCGCGGTSNDWHERYSTISYSQSSSTVVSYASSKRQTTSLGDGELWYFSGGNLNATAIGTIDADGNSVVIRQGYRYRTRTQNTVYHFYRWGDWSSWSLTKATATGSREVETRTVYRYNLYAKGQHKWDSGVVTTPAKPGIEGVKTYTCTACKQTRTEVIPALPITYTVSYDANGGSGAPASQTKTKDVALTLSSTKPTRTGYMFLGWAASKTATSAQYQPGGSYTANAAVTLYAVWKENAPTYATTLTVSSATASQGKEVSLNVSLAGNPGIIGINFQITYDKTRLKLIGYADGAMKDWSVGIGESEKAIWIDEAADVINGNILTLKFQVLDNAPDGLAEVTVTGFKAAALDESAVNANIVAGGVTVTSRIPGDVNDDGEVDIFDCVRLKKYLAGFNVTINASNADVNGDGEVDIFDCVRLKKYLAGMSVELK